MRTEPRRAKSAAILLALLLGALAPLWAADLDPCALLPKAEIAKIIGELKDEPKSATGLMKEKQCDYTNMEGAWLKVSLSSPENWGMQKGLAPDPIEIKSLGEEAFSTKRGTALEVWVRQGEIMLVVSSTVGLERTRKVAEAAFKKLP